MNWYDNLHIAYKILIWVAGILASGTAIFKFLKRYAYDTLVEFLAIVRSNSTVLQNGMKRLVRIEESLSLNTRLTKQALDLSGVIAFTSDKEGRTTWVSQAWCALTGLSIENALGTGWTRAISEDDRERVWKQWSDSCRDQTFYRSRYAVRSLDGKLTPVEAEAVPISCEEGRIVAYFGRITILPIPPARLT